jgi:mandelate racemase
MSKPVPAIRSVKARGIVVPLARPVKNAFGVIDVGPLVLIDVETDQGITGRSYIFAYARLTLKPLVHLIEEIGRELTGRPIAPYDLMATMDAKFRLLGWQGIVGMAVSGLDMAYWDALGQIAGRPVAELLGGAPKPIKAYDSYGVVDPVADEKALRRSLEQGFRGIKIKVGDGDAANDERMVKGVRALIGPDVALMIDFNQSLDPAEVSPASNPTTCTGSRSRCRRKTCRGTQKCARPRRRRFRPARTGGSRAALRKRSKPAPATSSCPT